VPAALGFAVTANEGSNQARSAERQRRAATIKSPGDPVTVTGGALSGHGTIDGPLVNEGGTVNPSDTGGVLEVLGSYEQGASGTLQVKIEGAVPGSGFGQLDVSEEATLAGALDVETGAFKPGGGPCYAVLPYSSHSGTFSSWSGIPGPPLYQSNGMYVAFGVCIATSQLPEGTRGKPYPSTHLLALDGKTPYHWKTVGALPKKLKLSKSGVLSGTPSTKIAAGTYSITVEVEDAAKKTAKVTLPLKLS
jgi:Putative Ig domain